MIYASRRETPSGGCSVAKTCVICGIEFHRKPANRTCCSGRCSAERKRRHDGNRRRAEVRACAECGQQFRRSRQHHSLCSAACSDARSRRRTAEQLQARRGLCRVCNAPVIDRLTCSAACFAALHPSTVLEMPRLRDERPQSCAPVDDPEEITKVRRLYCRRYETCLNYAAAAGWVNFSCNSCPVSDVMTDQEIEFENRELARVYHQRDGYSFLWKDLL